MNNFKRIAIYARYSNDLQNPTSVEDQIRLCEIHIKKLHPHAFITHFKDKAISGKIMHNRPGVIKLLRAAECGQIDLIYAEGLDRLSRNLKDVAAMYESLSYHNISIFTLHEGEVTQMHVAFKGLMNETAIKDMSEKVRRGQAAKVAAGFSNPSCPYGYRVIRGVVDANGRDVRGIREIDEEKAAIVRRIFEEFALTGPDRKTLKAIAQDLNADNIPSPRGKNWMPTTLVGSVARGDGILRNKAYIGTPIYGKTRVRRNPMTGKSSYPPTSQDNWTFGNTPNLRIIDDDLWEKAQKRLSERKERHDRALEKQRNPPARETHNQQALTGWVKCGWCGSIKHLANNKRYLCTKYRYQGQCSNARGTREPKLLELTLKCLCNRIKNGPDFRNQIIISFNEDVQKNQDLEHSASQIEERISRLITLAEHGAATNEIGERISALQMELDNIQYNISIHTAPNIPDESEIRSLLFNEISQIFLDKDIETMRIMFGHLLEQIILTPIEDKFHGETVVIKLREQGWPDFWKLLTQQ